MITKNINGNDISQGFIDEIRSDSPNTTARLMLDGSELSCDIVTISVQKGSCGSATFMIGSVVADMLTATVKSLSVDIKGKELEYQVGAFVNDAYEYISLGRFIVSEVKKTRYQQEITAYSNIVGRSGETLTPFLTSTPTLAQLGSKIAGQIGCLVKYDPDINTSLHITRPLDANLTVYNGIEILALCCGGYAINDNEGNIWIKRYNALPTVNVDTGMMTRLPEIGEQSYSVESVAVEVADATYDEQGNPISAVYVSRLIKKIHTHTGYAIKTQTNKYLVAGYTTDNADLMLSNKYVNDIIFSENIMPIIGYEYYPATVHLTLGDPRLEGSDVLSVTDVDGTEYVVPCHQITHAYTNTVISDITSATANNKANDIGTAMPITARLDKIERKTDASNQTADNAMKIAGNNNQYFWFTGSGTDTGAHITETPQEQFLSDPENGGGNMLARSNGVAMRDGLDELAIFSADLLRVGKPNSNHASINSASLEMYDTNNAKYFEVSASGMSYGTNIVASETYVDQSETDAIATASADATAKANTAESNAIATASADATAKANRAEANGKKEATNYLYYNASTGLAIAESNPSTATKKVQIDANGIKIQQSANNHADITSNGLEVFQNGNSVSSFGATARVGQANSSHVAIDSNGIKLYGADGTNVGATIESGKVVVGGASNTGGSISVLDANNAQAIQINNDGIQATDSFRINPDGIYYEEHGISGSDTVTGGFWLTPSGYTIYNSERSGSYFDIKGVSLSRYGWLDFIGNPKSTFPDNYTTEFGFGVRTLYGSEPYHELRMAVYPGASPNIHMTKSGIYAEGTFRVYGAFSVSGTKNRIVETKNYSKRLLSCYETPTPLFGDIGEAVLDESGVCYVDLDDIFTETIATQTEYQVFLQKEGEGDCYIAEKHERYFVIKGTPNLKVAWEIKAKQRDYETLRLEEPNEYEEYVEVNTDDIYDYVEEQERLLYG